MGSTASTDTNILCIIVYAFTEQRKTQQLLLATLPLLLGPVTSCVPDHLPTPRLGVPSQRQGPAQQRHPSQAVRQRVCCSLTFPAGT
jgi:hypothetical protein